MRSWGGACDGVDESSSGAGFCSGFSDWDSGEERGWAWRKGPQVHSLSAMQMTCKSARVSRRPQFESGRGAPRSQSLAFTRVRSGPTLAHSLAGPLTPTRLRSVPDAPHRFPAPPGRQPAAKQVLSLRCALAAGALPPSAVPQLPRRLRRAGE